MPPSEDIKTRPSNMPTVLGLGCPDDDLLAWGLLAGEVDLLLRVVDVAGVEMIASACRPVAVMVLDELHDLDPERFAQIERASGAVIVRVSDIVGERTALRSALSAAKALWDKRRSDRA